MEKYRVEDTTRGRFNFYKDDTEISSRDLVDETNRLRDALVGVQVLLEVGSMGGAISFLNDELHK